MSVRVKVKNYQSVKEADIIVEGLTLLKGASNAGKSSFFKAIEASIKNRFRTGCVTFNQDKAEIIIKYDDSPNIFHCTRMASGGSPKIRLGNKQEGYQTFDKLNRTVPDEVKEFHNFGTVKTSTDEEFDLNFVSQFTPPLLINFTARRIVDILASSEEMNKLFTARKILTQNNSDLKGSHKTLDNLVSETKDKIHHTSLEVKKLPNKKWLLKVQEELNFFLQRLVQLELLEQAMKEFNTLNSQLQVLSKLNSSLNEVLILQEQNVNFSALKTKFNSLLSKSKQTYLVNEIVQNSNVNRAPIDLLSVVEKERVSSFRLSKIRLILSKISDVLNLQTQCQAFEDFQYKFQEGVKKSRRRKVINSSVSSLEEFLTLQSKDKALKFILSKVPYLEQLQTNLILSRESQANNECPFCGSKITHIHE